KPIDAILASLTDTIYVTIDVDAFDPSFIPCTGTPEPGGLLWYQVMGILTALARAKRVVGFDIVELSPQKGMHAADFAMAKLAYLFMGLILSPKPLKK
ncbi:agmatinase, partial [Candidatus Woesearchaeota archaeon CG_4_10_14_0_8_um_filter_47_5]